MNCPQHDPLAHTDAPSAWEQLAVTLPDTIDDQELEVAIEPLISSAIDTLISEVPPVDSALLPTEVSQLHALGNFVASLARMYRTRQPNSDPQPLAAALLMLNKLALQRTWEVETLLRNGLDVGAVIASRPLYETSAKAIVLRKFHGTAGAEHLASHYLGSAMVETRNNARTHNRTWGQHGHPYDPDLLQEVEAAAAEQISAAGEQGNSHLAKQNGWAAPANNGKTPNLADLAGIAGIDDHQLAYAHGSHHIHANAYAAVTNPEPPGGPDIYGPPDKYVTSGAAGQYAALGLSRTALALIGAPNSDLEIRATVVLRALADRTYRAFHDADLPYVPGPAPVTPN